MIVATKPVYRAIGIGVAAAALLIGSFLLGSARSGASSATVGSAAASNNGAGRSGALLASSAAGGKITVTGTGTVSGTPNQLMLSMGVQTSASSVSAALQQANNATRRVISTLKADGVPAGNIQTSGLSIGPNYDNSGQIVGYDVSEQLTATLGDLAKAGTQIQAAVRAGGNAVTVDGVSLNLTDTSKLLGRARAAAIADAQAKASQFAHALGQPLGSVLSVSDQSPIPYPIFATGLAARQAASVPVQPGKQQVSVQITVVYAIG
jgi:uncharacterized protein YggE